MKKNKKKRLSIILKNEDIGLTPKEFMLTMLGLVSLFSLLAWIRSYQQILDFIE